MASLGKVSDDSTVKVMREFYQNIKTLSKAEALRQAQLDLMRSTVHITITPTGGEGSPSPQKLTEEVECFHPFFWAPFILLGDWREAGRAIKNSFDFLLDSDIIDLLFLSSLQKERNPPMMIRLITIVLVILVTALPASAQLDRIFKGLGIGEKGSGLSDAKIGSGLKEALRIGTENAVKLTGRTDGYFLNLAIKILMPEKLRSFEKGLRAVGYGAQVDDFILSMNRAAERAAPFAKQIFWDAIGEMTFEDVRKILSGHETAATDYFKGKTTNRLTEIFKPIVSKAMNEVGVTRQYKELVGRYEKIPFVKRETLDLDQYVVTKALDGLFHMVGEEERKIRKDPTARTTELLKEVFGK